MSEPAFVPPVLSTTQNEVTFQRYEPSASHRSTSHANDASEIASYYNIDAIAQYFLDHPQYEKVTLQFPDSLVADSSIVCQLLQQKVSGKVDTQFWILADTAYSACCVDEVASEHVKSQVVVHFGDACLNAIQKLPVLYSFGSPPLQYLNKLVAQFQSLYPQLDSKIVLMADCPHTQHIQDIYLQLAKLGYSNLVIAGINTDLANENVVFVAQSQLQGSWSKTHTLQNRILYSMDSSLQLDDETLLQDYKLFHITIPQDPHLLYLTTVFNSVSLFNVEDDSVSTGPFPSLMKRYKYMNVARTAGCVGILVNTLSLRNTKETISTLVKLLKHNGKKHYLFVVGKPNVAKLANFEPVDIWCILGCGQSGIILDQYNEFYKPIITPYELKMALNTEVTWTGKWLVDFNQVLNEIGEIESESESEDKSTKFEKERESEAPEFDVVTGKYVSTSRPLRNIAHLQIESPATDTESSKQLTKQQSGGIVVKGTVSTSASHLKNREWQGLGSDHIDQDDYEEDGATLEQGIFGVARGYQFDRQNAN